MKFAKVIVDVLNSQVDKVFEYSFDDNQDILIGDRVLIPFGPRSIEGFVLDITDHTDYDTNKIKSIIRKLDDFSVIKPEFVNLIDFLKNSYHLRMLDGIRLVVPNQVRKGVKHLEIFNITINNQLATDYLKTVRKNATNEINLINYLLQNTTDTFTNLSKKYSSSTLNKLIKNGILNKQSQFVNRVNYSQAVKKTITLTIEQQQAVDQIINTPNTYLLHGVTGSGKTEVYLHVIEQVIKNGQNAIMLVPEISLTPQMIKVFSNRFGDNLAVLHSKLNDGEKFDEWTRLYNGQAKIAIGPRSAIFAPLDNVGAIIIDEEHDGSYQSESNPRYFTHDIAEFRAKYNNCSLVLGSATPSIETFKKAKDNEYHLISLTKRVNNKPMPPIQIVDMCKEFRSGNTTPFSNELLSQLDQTITDKKQAILFLNRRGYSSFVMCRDCSHIPKCENCDVSLVYHKQDNELKCHYCGKRYKVLTKCPKCKSSNLKLGGVGTEQVCAMLKELYPDVNVFRMDNDSTKNKDGHLKIINDFSNSYPAILVGTQMIAKGHDFPFVNFVGILDADISLYFCDYKAQEKTFQLITQVAGRAGRSEIEGRVVLQTYFPKHYVYNLAASYDYLKFYEKEENVREITLFPPFAKIVRLLISSSDDELAKQVTHDIYKDLKQLRQDYSNDMYFLSAMKSPITKINSKFRYQIVIRYSVTNTNILNDIYSYIDKSYNKNVSVFVENNPQSLS